MRFGLPMFVGYAPNTAEVDLSALRSAEQYLAADVEDLQMFQKELQTEPALSNETLIKSGTMWTRNLIGVANLAANV